MDLIIFLTLRKKMQQNQQKVKAYELRRQETPALDVTLIRLRSELVGLRTSKVASAPSVKLARIRVVRKAIAKTLTVLNEKKRSAAKELWKKKKYTPFDLRAKGTKTSRLGMTKFQKGIKTARASKKAGNFRQRKYAVSA